DRPIDWHGTSHRDVVLIPWGEVDPGGARRAAGMFDAQSRFLPYGHCWRYPGGPITVPPIPPEIDDKVERLQGRWLFGGLFYAHFGHFLVETTTRLWAAPQIADLAGIVFYPKQRMTHEWRFIRGLVPFFAQCGLGHLKIRAPQSPVLIDEVMTPPPGFGMGEMMAGRPEYRDWVRDALGRDVEPLGAENIYVSRARLPSKRGAIMLETRLEELMAAAGYTIFHPQEIPLELQIAQWKAAKRIVGLDGSALHLAAMLAGPDTQVALINRGPSQNIDDYMRQFHHFAGITPARIEALSGFYHPQGRRIVKREVYATLDFPLAGRLLLEAGFIDTADGWHDPETAQLAAAQAEIEAGLSLGLDFKTIGEWG
ncbi:glycosyltransferase family 61 protein, partial [Roseicyclus sp.]|uniref:glycosyltransferase family 61 protein n=1 Tax=Roseicyclus sp. TaxID=1914329 RepID=UPI003F6D95B9